MEYAERGSLGRHQDLQRALAGRSHFPFDAKGFEGDAEMCMEMHKSGWDKFAP